MEKFALISFALLGFIFSTQAFGSIQCENFETTKNKAYNYHYDFKLHKGKILFRERGRFHKDLNDPFLDKFTEYQLAINKVPFVPHEIYADGKSVIIANKNRQLALLQYGKRDIPKYYHYRWIHKLGTPDNIVGEKIFLNEDTIDQALGHSITDVHHFRRTFYGQKRTVAHCMTMFFLKKNRREITYWDSGLNPSENRGILTPNEGKVLGQSIAAASGYLFLITKEGQIYWRDYDYDVNGKNPVFGAAITPPPKVRPDKILNHIEMIHHYPTPWVKAWRLPRDVNQFVEKMTIKAMGPNIPDDLLISVFVKREDGRKGLIQKKFYAKNWSFVKCGNKIRGKWVTVDKNLTNSKKLFKANFSGNVKVSKLLNKRRHKFKTTVVLEVKEYHPFGDHLKVAIRDGDSAIHLNGIARITYAMDGALDNDNLNHLPFISVLGFNQIQTTRVNQSKTLSAILSRLIKLKGIPNAFVFGSNYHYFKIYTVGKKRFSKSKVITLFSEGQPKLDSEIASFKYLDPNYLTFSETGLTCPNFKRKKREAKRKIKKLIKKSKRLQWANKLLLTAAASSNFIGNAISLGLLNLQPNFRYLTLNRTHSLKASFQARIWARDDYQWELWRQYRNFQKKLARMKAFCQN